MPSTKFILQAVTKLLTSSTVAAAVVGFAAIALGLLNGFAGVESSRWLSTWGKSRGTSSKAFLEAGIAGFVQGAVAFPLLATFIMVGVLSKSGYEANPISSSGFYALLFLFSIIGSFVGARWKWLGRILASLNAAFACCVTIAISFHMISLLPKIIFLAIVIILFQIFGVLVAMQQLAPAIASRFLCVATSINGAFLLAIAICLWQPLGFVDGLSLLVSENGLFATTNPPEPSQVVVDWTSSKVKGLIAGTWFLAALFSLFQLWRYSTIGEDPDSLWDQYLGEYVQTEKGQDRALDGRKGVFSPTRTFWQRLFSKERPVRPSHWPDEDDEDLDGLDIFDKDEEALDYRRKENTILFDPIPRYDSTPVLAKYDEIALAETKKRPALKSHPSQESTLSKYSGETLVGSMHHQKAVSSRKISASSIPTPLSQSLPLEHNTSSSHKVSHRSSYTEPKPGTVKQRMKTLFGKDVKPVKHRRSSSSLSSLLKCEDQAQAKSPASAPVEATPSLIHAINRISQAQKEAQAWRERQQIDEIEEEDTADDHHSRLAKAAEDDFLRKIAQ